MKSEVVQGQYVVGMSWATIVARGDLPKLARQRARRDKGNWFQHHGDDSVVGIAHLRGRASPPKGGAFFSPARMAAFTSPSGVSFFALYLPQEAVDGAKDRGSSAEGDRRVWICGLADGAPVNSFDRVVSEVEVPQLLEAFLQRRDVDIEDVAVHGDVLGMPSSMSPLDWESLVAAAAENARCRLQPVRQGLLDGVSPLGKAGIAVCAITGIAYFGYGEYQKIQRARVIAQNPVIRVDAAQEWRKALVAWARTKVEPGPQGIDLLRRGLATVPVEVSGWALRIATCQHSLTGWSCTGVYEPAEGALDAATGDFTRTRPRHWTVLPKGLQRIDVVFSISGDVAALNLDPIKPVAWHMENSTSALQKSMRGFANVGLEDFVPVQIPAPVGPDGAPVAAPAGMAMPRVASVRLAGPLRSLDIDSVRGLAVAWEQVVVTIGKGAASADLRSSAVMAEAKGVIYALQ